MERVGNRLFEFSKLNNQKFAIHFQQSFNASPYFLLDIQAKPFKFMGKMNF